ncbi:MAG: hypothetical protein CMO47_05390 [Verrucomicrobiales bacterium]|nr:hypothetical protein [Verrucomicrobiales bacterium]
MKFYFSRCLKILAPKYLRGKTFYFATFPKPLDHGVEGIDGLAVKLGNEPSPQKSGIKMRLFAH